METNLTRNFIWITLKVWFQVNGQSYRRTWCFNDKRSTFLQHQNLLREKAYKCLRHYSSDLCNWLFRWEPRIESWLDYTSPSAIWKEHFSEPLRPKPKAFRSTEKAWKKYQNIVLSWPIRAQKQKFVAFETNRV